MKASEGSEHHIITCMCVWYVSYLVLYFNAYFLSFFLFNDKKIKALSTMNFFNYHIYVHNTLYTYTSMYVYQLAPNNAQFAIIYNSFSFFLFTLKSHFDSLTICLDKYQNKNESKNGAG